MSSRAPQIINEHSLYLNEVNTRTLRIKFTRLVISGVPSGTLDTTLGKEVLHFRVHGVYTIESKLMGLYKVEHSIVFDAVKSMLGDRTVVRARNRPYASSRRQQVGVSLKLKAELDGQGLVEFIEGNRLNQFAYNTRGYGCRTWCEGLIEALSINGYVSGGALQKLHTAFGSYSEQSNRNGPYCIVVENGARFF